MLCWQDSTNSQPSSQSPEMGPQPPCQLNENTEETAASERQGCSKGVIAQGLIPQLEDEGDNMDPLRWSCHEHP